MHVSKLLMLILNNNLLYYIYGINRTDINTIYSVNCHALIDTSDTGLCSPI